MLLESLLENPLSNNVTVQFLSMPYCHILLNLELFYVNQLLSGLWKTLALHIKFL